MVDKKEIAKDIGLTVITGPFGKLGKALTQALKKHKEAKDKKEKARLQKLIDDLKSEIKLSKGDRGAAEAMPKKKAEEDIFIEKMKKRIEQIPQLYKKLSRGWTPPKQSAGPTGMTQQEMRRRTKGKFDMKKGGTVKTSKYAKGGGVRTAKYKV